MWANYSQIHSSGQEENRTNVILTSRKVAGICGKYLLLMIIPQSQPPHVDPHILHPPSCF